MKFLLLASSGLALVGWAAAAAAPLHIIHARASSDPLATSTSTSTIAQTADAATASVTPAADVAAATTASVRCDLEYCASGTSWCEYWGGISSFDGQGNPRPGETRKPIGTCGGAAATATTTA